MHVVQPERLSQAIRRSQDYILSQQLAEGFWVGELEANTTLTSEYILFRHLIGHVDTEREQKCVRYFLSQQQPDGGGPSTTVGRVISVPPSRRISPCVWPGSRRMNRPCNAPVGLFWHVVG